jgi:hypothetical protein
MTALFHPSQLFDITSPRSQDPDALAAATETLEQIAVTVREHWSTFAESDRLVLTAFVYGLLARPEGPTERLHQLGRDWFAARKPASEQQRLEVFGWAIQEFVNAVLDQIEHDHPEYEPTLRATLEQTFAEIDSLPALTAEEFGHELRRVSAEAFAEMDAEPEGVS